MSIVVLTFTSSEEEISSGIPRYVTIESNVPATIYFTLDGTTPTAGSQIYTDPVEIPDGQTSIILSAFGVDSGLIAGPILIQTFAPDMTKINVARHIKNEGIVLDSASDDTNAIDGFGASGEAIRFLDIDPIYLDVIKKDRGFMGIEEGTAIRVNIPNPDSTPSRLDDNFQPFSTPELAEFFNPEAKTIVIDNRIDNEVSLTLRPFGSLNNMYKEFGGKRIRESAADATYLSGGFVKRFYDAKNGIMVSYYFDHNECRYVKNIQSLPRNIPNISEIGRAHV